MSKQLQKSQSSTSHGIDRDKSKLHVGLLRAREFQLTITDDYIDNNNCTYHLQDTSG